MALDVARALQGVGGAILMPLTLTVLSAAVPEARRGVVLGIWGGVSGLAVALGPLVGGAIVSGISWHSMFWLNVPIGLGLVPFMLLRLEETRGPASKLDLLGLGLGSAGLVGIVWGLVRANDQGWTSPPILSAFVAGCGLLSCFVAWEMRTEEPMLPMHFFRNRTFALANVSSLLMFFGMFGSIFFIAQFSQTVQGLSPLQSGLRVLPWTAMPMLIAPFAGAASDRIGGQQPDGSRADVAGNRAGMDRRRSDAEHPVRGAHRTIPDVGRRDGAVLRPSRQPRAFLRVAPRRRQASGANNASRELGGVFGVAVLAAVFTVNGGYRSGQAFVDGMVPAVMIGAARCRRGDRRVRD